MLRRMILACATALCALPAGSFAASDIVVAQVAPFSGPLAPTGQHMKAGAQLYFDALNAAGGLNGAKIRLVTADDGYKTAETLRQVKSVADSQHPVAFFGIVGTGNVGGLLKEKLLERVGIPLIAARTGATSVAVPATPWLFLTRASYGEEIRKTVNQFVPLGYNRVAVFYQNDPFGQDGLNSLKAALNESGGTLVASGGYEKNTVDVAKSVETIAKAMPQLVVMISNTAASSEFVKQFRATGSAAQLSTISVTDGGQLVQAIGATTAHGLAISQVVPAPGNLANPLIREIRERLEKFPQKDVSLNHTLIEGYLGAKVLIEGLRRAGPDPTPKKLRDALEALHDYDAGGLRINFSPGNHQGSSYTDIMIINGSGKLIR